MEPSSLSGSLSGNSSVLVAAVLAVFVVGWAATNLVLLGGEGFAMVVSDKGVGGGRRPRLWLASSPPWCSVCSWLTLLVGVPAG